MATHSAHGDVVYPAKVITLFFMIQMIGVAFEVHDSAYLKRRDTESDEENKLKKEFLIKPSAINVINYSLCYIGLFTGKFSVFFLLIVISVEKTVLIDACVDILYT